MKYWLFKKYKLIFFETNFSKAVFFYVKTPVLSTWLLCGETDYIHSVSLVMRPDVFLT